MTEVTLTKWINDEVPKIKSEQAAGTFISDLFSNIVEWVTDEMKDEKPSPQKVYKLIKRVDEVWVYAGSHMESLFQVPLTRYGALIFMKMMMFSDDNQITFNQQFEKYVQYLDSKLKHYQPNNQPEMLHDFFEKFKSIEQFHSDPSQYPNDAKLELHQVIMSIYDSLINKKE